MAIIVCDEVDMRDMDTLGEGVCQIFDFLIGGETAPSANIQVPGKLQFSWVSKVDRGILEGFCVSG